LGWFLAVVSGTYRPVTALRKSAGPFDVAMMALSMVYREVPAEAILREKTGWVLRQRIVKCSVACADDDARQNV